MTSIISVNIAIYWQGFLLSLCSCSDSEVTYLILNFNSQCYSYCFIVYNMDAHREEGRKGERERETKKEIKRDRWDRDRGK